MPMKGGDSIGDSVQASVLPFLTKVSESYKNPEQKKENNHQKIYLAFYVPGQEDFIPMISICFLLWNKKGRSKMEKNLAGGQNCPLSADIHRIISCPGGMQEIRKITMR
jgi:hypothetical protein